MNHLATNDSGQGTDTVSQFRCAPGQNGFSLIVTLLLLLVLTLLAVHGLRSSITEEMVSNNQRQAASALFGSEQGVSQALDDLFAGAISDSGSEDDVNWSESGSTSGTGYSADYCVRHLVSGDEDYECPPSITSAGAVVEDDDGRRYFIIDSTGETDTGEARRMVEVGIALEWGAGSNVVGLVGCQGITGDSNIVTSSYSSSGQESDGDRGDMATTDPEAFLYLDGSSDMDVVGEIRSTGAIYMKSDALVRRDALANLRITVEGGDIFGSAYTNDAFYGCINCVGGPIYQGPSVTPNPLVPYPDCDPLNIDAIFNDLTGSMVLGEANDLLGISVGADFYNSTSDIGVDGVSSDYWFNNFTLDSEAELTVHGDVRMYITGDFLMDSNPELMLAPGASLKIYMESGRFVMNSNSMANHDPDGYFPQCVNPEDPTLPAGCPINLQIYSRAEDTVKDDKNWEDGEPDTWDDGDQKVVVNSNSVLFGMIYAPRAHVFLDSNVVIFGSVRGRFVDTWSNLAFTYDEDLDQLYTGSPSDYKLVYWTEKYPE